MIIHFPSTAPVVKYLWPSTVTFYFLSSQNLLEKKSQVPEFWVPKMEEKPLGHIPTIQS